MSRSTANTEKSIAANSKARQQLNKTANVREDQTGDPETQM